MACVFAGVWWGRFPFVADDVDLIAVGIVIVSLIPVAIEVLRARKTKA